MSITLLDGGMGRELLRIGAPFRQPEWSALALMEGPDWVAQAHRNFVNAGAHVITTNSYACVPFHLGAEVFAERGAELAGLAGRIAREVADSANSGTRVAGSLPPVMGSYRPDLFERDEARRIVSVLVGALIPFIDHWLIETTGSVGEARCSLDVVGAIGDLIRVVPRWVSFTLSDELMDGRAILRSGESIAEASAAVGTEVTAMLFNCSQPEVMLAAVSEAVACRRTSEIEIGVFANAFPVIKEEHEANAAVNEIRSDLTAERYREFAEQWRQAGASIIGGCCGIAPEHIAGLRSLTSR